MAETPYRSMPLDEPPVPRNAWLGRVPWGHMLGATSLFVFTFVWVGAFAGAIFYAMRVCAPYVLVCIALPYLLHLLERESGLQARRHAGRMLVWLAFVIAAQVVDRVEEKRLEAVRGAFHRYRDTHGDYPERLEQMTPRFIPHIPEPRVFERGCMYRISTDMSLERTVYRVPVGEPGVTEPVTFCNPGP